MSNDQPLPRNVPASRVIAWLTASIIVLLLVIHGSDFVGVWSKTRGNAAALRIGLSAAPGTPDQVVTAPSPKEAGAVTGVQARALAHAMAISGRASEAEAWLLAGLSDPTSADLTQFQLCRLYWEVGLANRALEACQGTVVSADYWLGAGFNALDDDRQSDALALFELAAYTDPNSSDAWRYYGRALSDAGRFEEAVVALERVLILKPSPTPDVYRSLAQSYLKLNNLTMTRDVLDQGLLIYPEQREYYTMMAESFLVEDDAKAADSWYVRMLQRWPYDAKVWAARGKIAQNEGRIDDAVSFYQEAATNSPDGFAHWMNLAAAAAEAQDAILVAQATSKALELQPDDPGAWLEVGRYLTETDQTDAARAAFERVLELQPDNLEAAADLAALLDTVVP